MSKICARLGCVITNVPRETCELGFKWKDTTWHVLDGEDIKRLGHVRMFNTSCVNISKRHVAQCFEEVFGRSLSVDPTRHTGPMVCKSDRNAAHDGIIVQGPIDSPAHDKFYSILVDNSEGANIVDIRVPIMRGQIPLVYVKRRPEHQRFGNKNSNVVIATPDLHLTEAELELIRQAASRLGMDYGEFDVLRDRRSHAVYVVDANNTPFGPPNGLSAVDGARAVESLSMAFAQVFLT